MPHDNERLLAAFQEMKDPKIRFFYLKLGEALAGLAPISDIPLSDLRFTNLGKHEPDR